MSYFKPYNLLLFSRKKVKSPLPGWGLRRRQVVQTNQYTNELEVRRTTEADSNTNVTETQLNNANVPGNRHSYENM